MKKRIFASILAVIMMLSVVAFVPAFAVEENPDAIVISAADVTVPANASVADVTVSVSNVPATGIASVRFNVKVEGALIASADPAELPDGGYAQVGPTELSSSDGVNFMWVDITTGISADTDLVTFHVTVPSGALCGAEYAVIVTLSEDPQDFTALDGVTDVPATAANGKITLTHALTHVEAVEATAEAEGNIEYWKCEVCGKYFADAEAAEEITAESVVTTYVPKFKPGDADGDGFVNARDVILTMKAALPGFVAPADFVFDAANLFNEDDVINARDVIEVMKAALAAATAG